MKTPTIPTRPNFRKNADQLVNFFGHGEQIVKFMGTCPVSGIRMYAMPGCPFPDHDYTTLEAKDYGMSGPDFVYSWLASNDGKQAATALEMARKTWFAGPGMIGKVTAVSVKAATYFDKPNGNPYFRADVYANGVKVLALPRQYGNDSQIGHEAANELHKAGYIQLEQYGNGSAEGPQRWADRNGATFTVSIYKATYKEFYNLGIYKN